jgi:glycosyltransferase involved in cell wall biosynthesis
MLSILVPVYNTKKEWLKQCFDSIFNQSYKDYEVIVVNDCSTNEETIDYLNSLKNIILINHEQNLGLPSALNTGLNHCNCELVARMDSDDIMLYRRLEVQVEYMKNNPNVDLLSTGLNYLIEQNNKWVVSALITHPSIITRKIAKNSNWFINHPTIIYKKSKILSLGGYDEKLKGYPEDFDLWIRMIKNGMILHNLQESLLLLRISNNTLSKTNNDVVNFCEQLRKEL